jgi:hypothetical protein
MLRISILAVVLGLASGCVASDSLSEAAVVSTISDIESHDETTMPSATTSSCVQLDRPRVEYWSEFPPEPGTPAQMDPYKTCVTQPDCTSICEGFDVVPSVYSWRGVIKCTRCT